MSNMAYAWLQRFDPEIWQEAGGDSTKNHALSEFVPHDQSRPRQFAQQTADQRMNSGGSDEAETAPL